MRIVRQVSGAWAIGGLLAILCLGCGELRMGLDLQRNQLPTLEDELRPTVVFHNDGAAPIYLPLAVKGGTENLALVLYRRSEASPTGFAEHTGRHRTATRAAATDLMARPADEATTPPYRRRRSTPLDPVRAARQRSAAASRYRVVKLAPGQTFRYPLAAVAAGELAATGETSPIGDDPQVGIWALQAFYNGYIPRDAAARLDADARNRLWRGTVRSPALWVSIADRIDTPRPRIGRER